MAATEGDQRPVSMMATWRTPPVIVVCGFLVGMLTLGPRSTVAFHGCATGVIRSS
jgi:hypothetical protein